MLRRLFILGAAALCLCGCAVGGIRSEKGMKEYETDYSSVRAEVISFDGMEDEEFEDALNEKIEQSVESDMIAFDSEASDSSENVRMGNKCIMEINWNEEYNKNGFLSIVEEKYTYTGGAHGATVRIPRNIDVSGSKEIELKDLFENDAYVNTLNRMINELVNEHPEEYKDLWAKPEIQQSHQTDFYINDDDKLVIFFQPYELSYYARGYVEFPLSLEELGGYMKEEYRRLAVRE